MARATADSIKHTTRRRPVPLPEIISITTPVTRRGVFSQHIRATAPLRGRDGGSNDNFQREYFPRDETAPNATRERVPRVFAVPLPRTVNARSRPLSYIFHYVPQDFPRPRESAPAARVNWRLSSRQGRRGGRGPGGRGEFGFNLPPSLPTGLMVRL